MPPDPLRVFGLDLRFTDNEQSDHDASTGISVVLNPYGSLDHVPKGTAFYTSPEVSDSGVPVTRIEQLPDGGFRIIYGDDTQFIIDARCRRIEAWWPPTSTEQDTMVYLLGPVLGILQRLRGITCLHASAVEVDGQAVAFMGPQGAGKSSTAAAFSRLGVPVLTDDIVALHERERGFEIPPGPRRVLLWPASVKALWGSESALPLMVEGWDKHALHLGQAGHRCWEVPLPLAAVYALEERRGDGDTEIEAAAGAAGLMSLVANTFGNRMLDGDRRTAELDVLSRVAQAVPIRRVRAVDDRSRIELLCGEIVKDFRALSVGAA